MGGRCEGENAHHWQSQKDGGERRWEMLGGRERTTPSAPFCPFRKSIALPDQLRDSTPRPELGRDASESLFKEEGRMGR